MGKKKEEKKIKVIKVSADDLVKYKKPVHFTKRFVPIQSTHRIRTVYYEVDGIKTFALELVDKRYTVIQRIHVGTKDTKIEKIKEKLLYFELKKKVVEEGIKGFYRKYHA